MVTFLFSDIEGSTLLLRELGDDFPDIVLEHRRRLRDVWSEHDGYEVGTEGDSFVVAFEDPERAVAAATQGQLVLADLPIRVRMGVHLGPVVVREDDYFGMPIHEAARVGATAHGGQIIVSDAVAQVVADSGLRDLGLHRLKDLAAPVRLHQLLHVDLPSEFPPPRSLTVMPNNFPRQTTPFFGREDDVANIVDAVRDTAVVTLTGAGGVGKTRLALQAAAELIDDFPHGAWFVDLAPVVLDDRVVTAVVQALALSEQAGREPIDSLLDAIATKELLLVLDNCEHVVDACAQLVAEVVAVCPKVKVLATSRESLAVPGELNWRLRSLQSDEAVELFADRANRVDRQFALTDDNARWVTQICERLDGLPLAIELAAARVRSLSVREIAQRLDDRFRLLTGGSRVAVPRQRTLEAAVAWSYDLLSGAEQSLFEHLSVFANGATLTAIAVVAASEDEAELLDRLDALVDRSLVVLDDTNASARYRQLETLRQYGRDRLVERGGMDAARDRLLAWALEFAEGTPQTSGQTIPREIALEEDNVLLATHWAMDRGDDVAALRLAGAVWAGHFNDRTALYNRLLPPKPGVDDTTAGRALFAGGGLSFMTADWENGAERMRLAAQHCKRAGLRYLTSLALTYQGASEWGRRNLELARELVAQGLAEALAIGDPSAVCRAMFIQAWMEAEVDLEAAEAIAVDGIGRTRAQTDVFDRAHLTEALAVIRWQLHGPMAGATALLDALELFKRVQVNCDAHILETAASWALLTGDPRLGAELWGSAIRVREETADRPRPWERKIQEEWLPAIEAALPYEEFAAAIAAGRTRDALTALAFAQERVGACCNKET